MVVFDVSKGTKMNVSFTTKSATSSLPFSRFKLLEEVINDRQHGTVSKIWCSAGHVFVLVQDGKQLFTFDTKPADLIQEVEGSGTLDITVDVPILDVLVHPPNIVYITQCNGQIQQWRYRPDYTWTMVSSFNICNVMPAEVTHICLNVSHKALYWCERRISSITDTETYCVCKRQLKDDDSPGVGAVVALLHNCPRSELFPMAHGIAVVTKSEPPQVSVIITLCTLTGKISVCVGNARAHLKDLTIHTAVDFRHLMMKCLNLLYQVKDELPPLGSVYTPASQTLVRVFSDGKASIISSSSDKFSQLPEVCFENFQSEGILDICFVQKYIGIIYCEEIRLYCLKSGSLKGTIISPSDEPFRGQCQTLLGTSQTACYTDTDVFLIQRCSKSVPSSDAILIEGGKFQTDAVRLAFLSQLKTDNKSEQLSRLHKAWEEIAGKPPSTKLVSLVEPYLKEYWKLEEMLQQGMNEKEGLPQFKAAQVEEEVDRILDPKSALTRTARQVQLLLLAQSHPHQVLTHLLSSLDLGTDELSTSQLQRWKCVLTQENCDVAGSCDLAIPLFEQISHLLFKRKPDKFISFLQRGQQACDQLIGVSAFIRRRQTLQVYERALKCIPNPVVSLDQAMAVKVTVQLLLTSETEGSVLKAAQLLVRYRSWEGAVDLLKQYADNSCQHALIFQIVLTALKQNGILHQFSDQIFKFMPSFQSLKEATSTAVGEDSRVDTVFCESEENVSVDTVRPHLLSYINNDLPQVTDS